MMSVLGLDDDLTPRDQAGQQVGYSSPKPIFSIYVNRDRILGVKSEKKIPN